VERLGRGELDLAIASALPVGAALVHPTVVKEEPLLLMMGTRHRLARQERIDPAALEGESFVALHEMH